MNAPIHPLPSSSSSLMTGLGQALRWLRERQTRKQYRVADSAGITKGMLSAYETGRQRPSLESLEKLLDTLGCDLNDLHNALQIVNGRPDQMRSWGAWESRGWSAEAAGAKRAAAPNFTIHELDRGAEYPAGAELSGAGGHEVREPSGRGYGRGEPPAGREPAAERSRRAAELYRILGFDSSRPVRRLPIEEEAALSQMLEGFHGLLRYWHRSHQGLAPPEPGEPPAGGPESPGDPTRR